MEAWQRTAVQRENTSNNNNNNNNNNNDNDNDNDNDNNNDNDNDNDNDNNNNNNQQADVVYPVYTPTNNRSWNLKNQTPGRENSFNIIFRFHLKKVYLSRHIDYIYII